jgi:hypothetical protein
MPVHRRLARVLQSLTARLVSQLERLVAIHRRMGQIMREVAKAAHDSMIDSADRLGDMCNRRVAPGDDCS